MPRINPLQFCRLAHLYIGVFISPALLFFALTGALQTFGLHETNRDHPNYKPAHWIVVLGQIHKKQTSLLPQRRPQLPPAPASADGETTSPDSRRHGGDSEKPIARTEDTKPETQVPTNPVPSPTNHPLPLRLFFLTVCTGLFASTLTGLYMAYTYSRSRLLITGLMTAGVVIPVLLVFL